MAQRKPRINWQLEGVGKTFLEACIHELTLHGREGSSLKQASWKNVAEKLKQEHGFIADQRQMKNRYDYLKGKFSAWTKLKNKTGNAYNSVTNTFDFSEADWEIEIKSNKYVEALRRSPLAYPELCVQLFEGSSSHGFDSWGPSSTLPHPSEEVSDHNLNVVEDIECTQMEPPTEGASEESFVGSKNKRGPSAQDSKNKKAKIKRRFQHSTETIHRCFHEVLNAMMNFAREVIVPTSNNAITNISERHRKLKQIFPGAIGALDGTLIHASIPVDQQTCYRGRGKGECFQNVLGICDFDMIFTFVWAGWEGIAHDSRVLKEVAFNPTSNFPFPQPDKYYLCDAAYTNTRGFMTPYRNTRYWLADFRRQRALTKEERFNHAHAKLRNVIERAYGVLKARFPILKQMAPFPFSIQRDIVIACFAVHNFIRKCNIHDQLFMDFDENNMFSEIHGGESENEFVQDIEWGSHSIEYMNTLRDEIATQLISNVPN